MIHSRSMRRYGKCTSPRGRCTFSVVTLGGFPSLKNGNLAQPRRPNPLNIPLHRLRKITHLRTSPALPIALVLALALVCVFVNQLPGAHAQNQTSFVSSRAREKSVDF